MGQRSRPMWAMVELKAALRRERVKIWMCQCSGGVLWRRSPKMEDRADEVPGDPQARISPGPHQ